jgi:protein subunit release factor B
VSSCAPPCSRNRKINLNERFDVRPEKVTELLARIKRLGIDVKAIEETFTRGSGKGGQKINKTSSCVQLSYDGLRVRCQRERRRTVNRFLALRLLVDKIEARKRREIFLQERSGSPDPEA